MKTRKNKNPFAHFFLTVFWILLGIIVLLSVWCVFSALDKKNPLDILPPQYSAYIHTDSFYEAANPLLNVQAADIVLSSDEMSDIRGIFMLLRESELREQKFIKFFLSRKIDAAFYTEQERRNAFVASVDLGVFSSVSRLATFFLPRLHINGISKIQTSSLDFFTYENGDAEFYFKPVKNLVIVSNDLDTFTQAVNGNNAAAYTPEQIELLERKTDNPIKLIINAKKLAESFLQGNKSVENILPLISDNALSLISFQIADSEIALQIEIPMNTAHQNFSNGNLLSRNSAAPELPTWLSTSVQYYTILNAGTIQELKSFIFPLVPKENKIDELWKNADKLMHTFFKISLDELLSSWTADEFAVIGIEDLNDPVFAIKIADEQRRREIFNTVIKSFLLNENKSLILNGVRIPRLEFPPFIQGLLNALGISLKTPYFLVYNNYIYFSQSAESLSAIYATFSNGTNISFNENWKAVAAHNEPAAVSLFYDLEKSRPFFINSRSELSKILELYPIGRANIFVKDSSLFFKLNATSRRKNSLRAVPGFPVELNGKHNSKILTCAVKNPSTVFWLENERTLNAMNVKKTKTNSYIFDSPAFIQTTENGGKEMIMALTKNRELFLFNENLEIEKGYPILIPEDFAGTPYLSFQESCIPSASGKFYLIQNKKITATDFGLEPFENVKILPYYDGKRGTIYERGFLGKIFILSDGECINKDNPVLLDKIGFGNPAILEKSDGTNTFSVGFVSQSGKLSVFRVADNNTVSDEYEIQLDGLFNTNLAASGNFFFALSTDGELFKIDAAEKTVTSVKIDYVTAKEGLLSVQTVNGKKCVTVGIDGNVIYCFTEDLELVYGFPVAGTGIPAFADVNGDSHPDCFALTVDNKLNAWNLR